MYAPFFGLSKEPFSIAPDPRFLFMSDQHREALAHLLYGVSGGGGFVLLTGAIGAGKTTVCRAFLDQVPANCAVAYIFNPKLEVIELLQTVCEEFGIELPTPAPARGRSAKEYVDALNRYLLSAHASGCHAVLIIDEAQSLAPEVLEQLRLLTNLETSDKKLLQIVLIGQPELRELLMQPQMEQLAQRVIARYHLPALGAGETAQYIQHRLAVASPSGPGVVREPFDSRAVQRVHALSGGVPRRINLLCDRALLGAYAHGQQKVTAAMVDKAAQEVFGEALPGEGRRAGRSAGAARRGRESRRSEPGSTGAALRPYMPAMAGAALLSLGLLLAAWFWRVELGLATAEPPALAQSAGPAAQPPAPAASAPPAKLTALPEWQSDPGPMLAAAWREEAEALRELAGLWQLELTDGDPCERAAASGMLCHRAASGLGTLRQLGRPAVLVLRGEQAAAGAAPAGYAVLLGVEATGATLAAGDQVWRLSLPALGRVWRGEYVTYWRTPPGWRSGIDAVEDPTLQSWLLQRLGEAGGIVAGVPLREQVRSFQVANALPADGRAGPLTLMLLGHPDEPRLLQDK